MKTITELKNYGLFLFLFATMALVTSCSDDDDVPHHEHDHDLITDVTLVFTNVEDPNDVVEFSAKDPDGEGIKDIEASGPIELDTNKEYELTFEIYNSSEDHDEEDEEEHNHSHARSEAEEPGHEHEHEGENIGEIIEQEGDAHQFFFEFTEDAFADPMGSGNISDDSGTVRYNDEDKNGNPIGLKTLWKTPSTETDMGSFKVLLKHQPDIKTGSTTANDGETDVEITFELHIHGQVF